MIRLDLGAEPRALSRVRAQRLAKAIVLFDKEGVGEALRKSLSGYREAVAEPLFLRQQRRCAYCERPIGLDGNPVEHFRPKREAHRDGGVVDPDRYWWLTWNWENLVLACATCNALKRNHFPLEPGTQPMQTPSRPIGRKLPDAAFDVSRERPLLLDPRRDQPHLHCRWTVDDDQLPMSEWKWRLWTCSARARRTAKLLELDAVTDEVNQIYAASVLPQWETVAAMVAQDPRSAVVAWGLTEGRLLKEPCAFPLAVWSMLDRLRSEGQLAALKLPSPPPPVATWPRP